MDEVIELVKVNSVVRSYMFRRARRVVRRRARGRARPRRVRVMVAVAGPVCATAVAGSHAAAATTGGTGGR